MQDEARRHMMSVFAVLVEVVQCRVGFCGVGTRVHQYRDGAGREGLHGCLHVQQRCRWQVTDSCCVCVGVGVVLFACLLAACLLFSVLVW